MINSQSPYPVYAKAVISGSVVEYYQYEKPYHVGVPRILTFRSPIKVKKPDQTLIRADNVRRARQKIRRLINANPDMLKFMTLTFKEEITDLEIANKYFDIFIKRLKRLYPNFKYLAVPEFQKRGVIHYHVLTNIEEFIANDDLANRLWGNGFAWFRDVYNVDNLGAYVCKYLSKEIFDKRYFRKKKFFYSLNLLKPIVLDQVKQLNSFFSRGFNFFYEKVYDKILDTDFLGVIKYKQYKKIKIVEMSFDELLLSCGGTL